LKINELELGVNTSKDKAALARYVTALRKVWVCRAALNFEVRSLLAVKASSIEKDIAASWLGGRRRRNARFSISRSDSRAGL
jgi:hypothetical protein